MFTRDHSGKAAQLGVRLTPLDLLAFLLAGLLVLAMVGLSGAFIPLKPWGVNGPQPLLQKEVRDGY